MDTNTGERIAFDICPANMPLNYFAANLNLKYDNKGEKARSAGADSALLLALNNLEFYSQHPPKSLGREWFEREFLPLCLASELTTETILSTLVEHIAQQTGRILQEKKVKNVLVTGGGALNDFLIERLRFYCPCELVVGNKEQIHFKEALIFAFLGYLRLNNKTNVLKSVTGASRDSVTGAIYHGK
jgi:anhydro-N-acetylmuramic acid kinase